MRKGVDFRTRHEEVVFDFKEVPFKNLTPKNKLLLKKLNANIDPSLFSDVVDGDTYTLHYKIGIDYYGSVERNLTIIEQLLDNGFVIEAISRELKHMKCLAQSMFVKLERIEKKYEKDVHERVCS